MVTHPIMWQSRFHDQIEDPNSNEEEQQDVGQHEDTSELLQKRSDLCPWLVFIMTLPLQTVLAHSFLKRCTVVCRTAIREASEPGEHG